MTRSPTLVPHYTCSTEVTLSAFIIPRARSVCFHYSIYPSLYQTLSGGGCEVYYWGQTGLKAHVWVCQTF